MGLYKRGSYVKVTLKGFETSFGQLRQDYPIILARINVGEDNQGLVKVRIKKHRWYSNILKSHDPVIFSVGWRRFQTMPVYCVQD
jgi:ribosome biogenesis protein BMS1